MTNISENLQAVRSRIAAACARCGRDPASVTLLAVSKTQPLAHILAAVAAGQYAFGENYVQEGVDKIAAAAELDTRVALEWHFIGPLQSNKTRPVANAFSWVHSVDRFKIAQRLSEQRDAHLPPLNLCIQVNVSAEQSKSGVAPEALVELAEHVAALPRVRLRGLMALPEPSDDEPLLHARFAHLRQLRDDLNARGLALDTLSMGMSHDLEAAIAEGATLVRIGTAVFGRRS